LVYDVRLERDFKSVQVTYRENTLRLWLLRSFAKKLLGNEKVITYLRMRHTDLLREIQSVIGELPSTSDGTIAGHSTTGQTNVLT